MTQLLKFPDAISNYFDRILRGIGKRGSSFSNVDAISHDGDTHRFLVQEFKTEYERIQPGQHWMLRDLAALPQHFTVWHVVKRDDGAIGFAEFGSELRVITVDEYRARFTAWWADQPFSEPRGDRPPHAPVASGEFTQADIPWQRL